MADIIFPTETPDATEIALDDRIIVSDSSEADLTKDVSLSDVSGLVSEYMLDGNLALPKPTEPHQMIVVDDNMKWVMRRNFDLGKFEDKDIISLQFRRRMPNEGGPGAPSDNGKDGEIVLNFDVGINSQAELWAWNGTTWELINQRESITTAYIQLPGGTPGTPAGIGAAWDAYDPKPTTDFVIADYGYTAYIKNGEGSSDGDWTALIPNDVLSPAVSEAQRAAENAMQSEQNASSSAIAADASAQNAATSEQNADNYQSAAQNYRDDSQEFSNYSHMWAQYPEDTLIPNPPSDENEYSAYHWAQKAAQTVTDVVRGITGEMEITVDESDEENPIISFEKRKKTIFTADATIQIDVMEAEVFIVNNDAALEIEFINFPVDAYREIALILNCSDPAVTFKDTSWPGGTVPTFTADTRNIFTFRSYTGTFVDGTLDGGNMGPIVSVP